MGTEKSLPSDYHFARICWPLVLFWSISLPVELVLLALLEGCPKREKPQLASLHSAGLFYSLPNQIPWAVA